MRLNPLSLALTLVLTLGLASCGSEQPTESSPVDDLSPNTLGPDGGTLSFADGAVTLTVPAGALSQDVTFSVAPTNAFPASERVVGGTVYEIGPAGTTFAQPAELSIAYDEGQIPAGVDESSLALHKVESDAWSRIDGSAANTGADGVSGRITSLSTWGVLGDFPLASVVINEVQTIDIEELETRAGSVDHGADYVELYVLEDGYLDGIRLVATAIDRQKYGTVELEGEVEAGDFVLIGGSDVPDRDATFVGLQEGPGGVELIGPDGTVLDAVEWGGLGLDVAEGAPFLHLPLRAVLQRRTDGEDTDDNALDLCLQLEGLATPGEPNELCPPFAAFLWLEFLDLREQPVQLVVLKKNQAFPFNAWLENIEPPASAPATQIDVSPLTSLDPQVVRAFDLDGFPRDRLELSQRDKQPVAVTCLVEEGATVVFKYATTPDEEPFWAAMPVTAAAIVVCDPTGIYDPEKEGAPWPDDGKNPPPPKETDTEPPTQPTMEVTIVEDETDGAQEVPPTVLAVLERVQWWVRVRNTSTDPDAPPLLGIARPAIDPGGMRLVHQGTWPEDVVLRAGEEIHQSFTLECPRDGSFMPAAASFAANATAGPPISDSDDVDVQCVDVLARALLLFGGVDSNGGFINLFDPEQGEPLDDVIIGPDDHFTHPTDAESFLYVDQPADDAFSGDIFHAELDGGNARNLTSHPAFYRMSSASVRGDRVVFESDRDRPGSGCALCDVFVMNLDGSGLEKVLTDAGHPSFAPDGRIVYAAEDPATGIAGSNAVWIANADGSGATRLMDFDFSRRESWEEPVVSPDGTRIAAALLRLTADGSTFEFVIAVGDFDGTEVTSLRVVADETGGNLGNRHPAWSPDGSRIAFTSDRTGIQKIWWMNPDGSEQEMLTGDRAGIHFHPAWVVP